MKKVICLALIGSILTGCGSIINGTSQSMSVVASPSNAIIRLYNENGSLINESRGSMFYNLDRSSGYLSGASYNLEITRAGYHTKIIPIVSKPSGWYMAGNIVIGGLIGWLIVDPATGGMWALESKEGQDVDNLRVVLLEDAPMEVLMQAKKVEFNE